MCQRVCLLPCLASVKAVYIGPDGGGNSAQLSSSPRLRTEQWTEAAVICIHYTHRRAPPVWKTRAPRAAGWGSRCYCRVRLFQLNTNTNQTRSHAGLLRTVGPPCPNAETRLTSGSWGWGLFLSALLQSAFISTHNWSNNQRVHVGWRPFKVCSSVAHVWNMTVRSKRYPNPFMEYRYILYNYMYLRNCWC